MAGVVRRKRGDGTTAYRVTWREGGRSGRQQSETFDTPKAAERFRADVEAADNRWPGGWTPGVGYLEQPVETNAEPVLFTDFAELYLNTRTRVSPYQMRRYRRDIAQMAESFPTVEAVSDQTVAAWCGRCWHKVDDPRPSPTSTACFSPSARTPRRRVSCGPTRAKTHSCLNGSQSTRTASRSAAFWNLKSSS